jgi:small subunit ribosomal protein S20
MANHASAEKKNRADVQRNLRNRQHISRLRSQVKKFRQAVASGDAAAAKGMLGETLALVDRSAKHGVIHDNAAARTKSRLVVSLTKLSAK